MPVDPESPMGKLLAKTREVDETLKLLVDETSPAKFDETFTEVEPKLLEWKSLFGQIDRNDQAQANAAARLGTLIVDRLIRVNETSARIGATKGRKSSSTAPAAGKRRSRKMSRKYCKKTPCRKMGFSQRASCRRYKKCSTRRARRPV